MVRRHIHVHCVETVVSIQFSLLFMTRFYLFVQLISVNPDLNLQGCPLKASFNDSSSGSSSSSTFYCRPIKNKIYW